MSDKEIFTLKYNPDSDTPYKENNEDFETLHYTTLNSVLSSAQQAELTLLKRDCNYTYTKDEGLEKAIKTFKGIYKDFRENKEHKYDKVINGYNLTEKDPYDTPIELLLPLGAEIVSVKGFRGNVQLFVSHHYNEQKTQKRVFLLIPMQEVYISKEMVFIDTVVFGDGDKITNVFEIIKEG